MKLGTIEYRKYHLSNADYEEIYEMYKGAKMHREIAEKFKLNQNKVNSVISQINGIIIERQRKYHKIIMNEIPTSELSSFKDLLMPCDNYPTVGAVVIKDNQIIHDGKNITDDFRTLKTYI